MLRTSKKGTATAVAVKKKKHTHTHENNDKTAPLHENGRWKNKKRESNKKD